jgi:hypothetical protein
MMVEGRLLGGLEVGEDHFSMAKNQKLKGILMMVWGYCLFYPPASISYVITIHYHG